MYSPDPVADALSDSLLPPLWALVASYAHRAERAMLAALPMFAVRDVCAGDDLAVAAAQYGGVNVLSWMWRVESYPWCWDDIRDGLIVNNHVAALRWLVGEQKYPLTAPKHSQLGRRVSAGGTNPDVYATTLAAHTGSLDVASYLLELGCKWNCRTTTAAAGHGYEMFETFCGGYLNCSFPMDINTFIAAVRSDDRRTVMRIAESQLTLCKNHGRIAATSCARSGGMVDTLCDLDIAPFANEVENCARVSTIVAAEGFLDALKALRRHFYPWNSNICAVAAAYGHWPVVMWARDNGCPWIAETRAAAQLSTDPAVIAWMAAGGDAP